MNERKNSEDVVQKELSLLSVMFSNECLAEKLQKVRILRSIFT